MSPLRGPLSRWMSTESRESSDDTQLVTFFNHGRHFPLQPTGGPWFSLLSPLPGTLSSRLSAWLLSLFFKSLLKCAFTVILCLNPIYICNTIPTAAFSNLAWGPPKQSPNKGFHAGSHFKVWSYEQKGRTGHVREGWAIEDVRSGWLSPWDDKGSQVGPEEPWEIRTRTVPLGNRDKRHLLTFSCSSGH